MAVSSEAPPPACSLVAAAGSCHQGHRLGLGQLGGQLGSEPLLLRCCGMGPGEHALQDVGETFGRLGRILLETLHTEGLDGAGKAQDGRGDPGFPLHNSVLRVVGGWPVDALLFHRLPRKKATADRVFYRVISSNRQLVQLHKL